MTSQVSPAHHAMQGHTQKLRDPNIAVCVRRVDSPERKPRHAIRVQLGHSRSAMVLTPAVCVRRVDSPERRPRRAIRARQDSTLWKALAHVWTANRAVTQLETQLSARYVLLVRGSRRGGSRNALAARRDIFPGSAAPHASRARQAGTRKFGPRHALSVSLGDFPPRMRLRSVTSAQSGSISGASARQDVWMPHQASTYVVRGPRSQHSAAQARTKTCPARYRASSVGQVDTLTLAPPLFVLRVP